MKFVDINIIWGRILGISPWENEWDKTNAGLCKMTKMGGGIVISNN